MGEREREREIRELKGIWPEQLEKQSCLLRRSLEGKQVWGVKIQSCVLHYKFNNAWHSRGGAGGSIFKSGIPGMSQDSGKKLGITRLKAVLRPKAEIYIRTKRPESQVLQNSIM